MRPRAPAADRHDARDAQDTLRCLLAEWRVGGKVARNVYAMVGDHPGEDDIAIGQFDSGMLAREVVMRHNDARIRRGRR